MLHCTAIDPKLLAWIGIDPGVNGAAVLLATDPCSPTVHTSVIRSGTDQERFEQLQSWTRRYTIQQSLIEQVGGYIAGGGGNIGSAMFTFGESYGIWKGFLTALSLPFNTVNPRKWQSHYGLYGKGANKVKHKKLLRDKAHQLFPESEVIVQTADAFLIAEYCRRTYGQVTDQNGKKASQSLLFSQGGG